MKNIISVLILFYTSTLFGQTELPKVIPPAPETQALFKALDYPMNNSTGVPDITIPLYTIKHGDIVVPITLTYHASGRKVSDVTGPIGLGWSLNCGGMISRTIYGKPDFSCDFIPSTYKNGSDLQMTNDYTGMANIFYNSLNTPVLANSHNYDSEYDIYSYSFCGKYGKFIFDRNNQDEIVMFPPNPIKILSTKSIIDERGIAYIFNLSESPINGPFSGEFTGNYLTQIISPNQQDKITFSYQTFNETPGSSNEYYNYNDAILVSYAPEGQSLKLSLIQKNLQKSEDSYSDYLEQRISEIDFEEGKIKFDIGTEADHNRRINSMQILDKSGNILKTFQFIRSHLDYCGTTETFKLDDIIVKDKNNVQVEKYHFAYYPSEFFNISSKDYWGFRNGTDYSHLLETYDIQSFDDDQVKTIGSIGTDRAPHWEYACHGVLNKIYYPTGGSVEFIYEGNTIEKYVTHSIEPGPGLRVKQINTYDNFGNKKIKTYSYPIWGTIPFRPNVKYNTIQKIFFYAYSNPAAPNTIPPTALRRGDSYNTRIFNSESSSEISYFTNQPIFYSLVTEYNGTPEENSGYISYSFEGFNYASIGQYYPLSFTPPKCTHPLGGYLVEGRLPEVDGTSLPYYVQKYILFDNSRIKTISYFSNDGKDANGKNIYRLVRSEDKIYKQTNLGELRGIHVSKLSEFANAGEYDAATTSQFPVFLAADYYIPKAKIELDYETSTDYFVDGNLTTKTTYTYNDKNLIGETKKEIDTDSYIIKYAYPFDPAYNTIEPYKTMVSKNMLNFRIEESTLKNSILLSAVNTTYKDFGNNIIAPEFVKTKKSTGAYENRIQYLGYDNKGNITELKKVNDYPISYIWGYDQKYPVAQIENASLATVKSAFGGSIPSLGSGGLSSTQINTLRTVLPTTALVTISDYIPLIGVSSQTDPNGVKTSYTYDDFGRLMMIKDDDGRILKTIDYMMVNPSFYSAAKSQSFTRNNCGSNLLGTSVIYTVNEGIYTSSISQVDADSKANADITKNGQNYANLCGICFAYSNTEKSKVFTKNDCQSGYLGSDVTYTVPAGKYTSIISGDDAEQKAINDLNTNGQAYANTNGTCRPNITYYSVAKSGVFVKSNCSFGYTGSQVTYNVVAGKYTSTYSQADADQIAQTDVNNNGQSYANTNGSCSLTSTQNILVNSSTQYDVSLTFTNSTGQSNTYNVLQNSSNKNILVPNGTYRLTISLVGCISGTYYYTDPSSNRNTSSCSYTFTSITVPSGTNTITIQ